VVLADGGASMGYCLYLSHGKPAFAVRSGRGPGLSTVTAKTALADGWNTVTARITPDEKLSLEVNGQPAGIATRSTSAATAAARFSPARPHRNSSD
jgi:hypothetical protein